MNAQTKRGALIGCGFFARNHLHAWAQIADVEIVALCDIDQSRAEQLAQDFGGPSVHNDAARMLNEVALDFVDIATTAPSHCHLVELAAANGVAVICQKPLAETMTAAMAMVAACAAAGVPLIVHENFRWQRPFVVMREQISLGRIGVPHFARFSFRHGYDNYRNQPYLAQIERFSILDLGLHLFDLARLFMGEVAHLSCSAQHLNAAVRGEDAFTALLQHTNGATSICDCSFQSVRQPEPFPQTLAEIEGPDGTLTLGQDYALILHDAKGCQHIACAPVIPDWGSAPWQAVQDSVVRFQRHAADVLHGRAAPQPSGADNLHTLALSLAAYDAVALKQTIEMATWEAGAQ